MKNCLIKCALGGGVTNFTESYLKNDNVIYLVFMGVKYQLNKNIRKLFFGEVKRSSVYIQSSLLYVDTLLRDVLNRD